MFAVSLVTLSLFAARALAQELTINSPEANACGWADFTWNPTSGPYSIAFVNPDDPCNNVYYESEDFNDISEQWLQVPLPAGTKFQASILDGYNNEAWSEVITVGDGATDCVPDNLSYLLPSTSAAASSASSTSESASATSSSASNDNARVATSAASSTHSSSSSSAEATTSLEAVGAAQAGIGQGNNNGASATHLTTPALLLGAVAAVAGFAL